VGNITKHANTNFFQRRFSQVAAMELIGMDTAQRTSIWRLLAGLLHLGNVTFEESAEDEEAAQVTKANQFLKYFKKICPNMFV
jgi:myosin heavy subunit